MSERETEKTQIALGEFWVLLWCTGMKLDSPGSVPGSVCCCSGSRKRPFSRRGLGRGWRTGPALPAQDLDDLGTLEHNTGRVTKEQLLFLTQ